MDIKYACGGLLLKPENDKEWDQIHAFFELLMKTPKRTGTIGPEPPLTEAELAEAPENGGESDAVG